MVGSNFKSVVVTAKLVCVRVEFLKSCLKNWYYSDSTMSVSQFAVFLSVAFSTRRTAFFDLRRFAIPATEGNKICFESFSNFGNTRNSVKIRLDFLRNLW